MAKRPDTVVNKIQFDSSEVDMALRKQIPEKPIFLHNRSDTCSLWECFHIDAIAVAFLWAWV